MRVGILGPGLMGGKLGTLFARAGHEVVFSYVGGLIFSMWNEWALFFDAPQIRAPAPDGAA